MYASENSKNVLIPMASHPLPRMQWALAGAKRLECGRLRPVCYYAQTMCLSPNDPLLNTGKRCWDGPIVEPCPKLVISNHEIHETRENVAGIGRAFSSSIVESDVEMVLVVGLRPTLVWTAPLALR